MPLGFPRHGLASGLAYRAQPGDIFVSAYPKCGTTWTQHIVYLLLHEGRPLGPGQRLTEAFPHLEEVGGADVAARPPPRLIKTHLPCAVTPHHPQARYLYVARNPFDCAVSFFHHTRGFPKHYDFAHGTFDDFFECFIAGEVDFGDYFDNLVPWYARRHDENVLFLTYEAMKADTRGAVVRIGEFLGASAAAHEDVLDAILRHSSFEHMRKHQDRWSSRRPKDMPAFVRRGVVGDWINEFSPHQTRRLLDKFVERARGCDLETIWPEILAAAREHC